MLSLATFTTAALTLAAIVNAAPTPDLLSKRAGVSCRKAYAGSLATSNSYTGTTVNTNVYIDGNGILASDSTGQNDQIRIEFDICETDGWNVDGQMFGQVKPEDDYYNCFTITNETDSDGYPFNGVTIQPCGDYNGGILANQWFKAEFDQNGGFKVYPYGNPNDNPSRLGDASILGSGSGSEDVEIHFVTEQSPDLTALQFMGLETF